jgi:hypothetical protein
MTEDGVVADLLQLRIGEPQPRGGAQVDGLAPADLRVGSLVPGLHEGGEFVDGEVVLDAVAELLGEVAGVVGERLGCLDRPPAAVAVLEGLGQVPVVQGGEGLDPGLQQRIDQAAVEVEALGVGLAGALGEDPGPGDREPVGGRADVLHQRHVLPVAVVVVVGHIAVLVVLDVPRRVGVGVPDRGALAVLVPGPLDLVRGGGHAPVEPIGEPAADGCG